MELNSRHTARDIENSQDEYANLPNPIRASMVIFPKLAQTLQKQQFCDLIFELKGGIKFHTHRLVIALWSPVMMNLLNQSSCRVERVMVRSGLQTAFKQFVHFMYTGTFEGNITDVHGALQLACTFQISLLRHHCEKHLMQQVSTDKVIGLFLMSVRYNLPSLERQCVKYIRDHIPEVGQQSQLKELNPEQFNSFLASQHMCRLNPEMKFFLIISWMTEHVLERQHFLVLLLRHINWSAVAQDFLTEIKQTENFFTNHPSSLYLLLQTLHSASIPLGPYTDKFEELRQEHSSILANVVTSSVEIGTGRCETFQPISLTVISGPSRDRVFTTKKPNHSDLGINNSSSSTVSEVKEDMNKDATEQQSLNVRTASHEANAIKTEKDAVNSKGKRKAVSRSRNESAVNTGPNTQGQSNSTKITTRSSAKSAINAGSTKRKLLRPQKLSLSKNSSAADKGMVRRTRGQDGKTQLVVKEESVISGAGNESEEDSGALLSDCDVSAKKQLKTSKITVGANGAKIGRPRKGEEKRKFGCSECDYVTRKSSILDKHIQQAHETKRIFNCPMCEFQCSWSKKLYLHVKADHYADSAPPYHCDIEGCSYSIDRINKLVEHRRSHTGDRPFMCDECKMSFRSKSNLYAHLKCHSDERLFSCPKCSRSFKTKLTLKQHVVVHQDDRPYLCSQCGFSTKYESHMRNHQRRHTGDVFPCTFPACTYTTPKKSTLQAHMRSHLGIRQFKCGSCNKSFIEKSHLVRHMRIHTGEKQYKCPICDYASNRQDKLKEHLQVHERASAELMAGDGDNGEVAAPKQKRKRKKKNNVQTIKAEETSLVSEEQNQGQSSEMLETSESNCVVSPSAHSESKQVAPGSDLNCDRAADTQQPSFPHLEQVKNWTNAEEYALADKSTNHVHVVRVSTSAADLVTEVNYLTNLSNANQGLDYTVAATDYRAVSQPAVLHPVSSLYSSAAQHPTPLPASQQLPRHQDAGVDDLDTVIRLRTTSVQTQEPLPHAYSDSNSILQILNGHSSQHLVVIASEHRPQDRDLTSVSMSQAYPPHQANSLPGSQKPPDFSDFSGYDAF